MTLSVKLMHNSQGHALLMIVHPLGLRYVNPYYFTFTTHAKGRWVGSTVYSIFCKEFQSETPEFYVSLMLIFPEFHSHASIFHSNCKYHAGTSNPSWKSDRYIFTIATNIKL